MQVIYRFYGQEKLVNWSLKKIEAVKKKLEYKVCKCLRKSLRKLFNFVIFSILISKNFALSADRREKESILLFCAESEKKLSANQSCLPFRMSVDWSEYCCSVFTKHLVF